MKTIAELADERRKLQAELEAIVDQRSACKTHEERLKLIREVVRITAEIQRVEDEFEKLTGLKMQGCRS